MRQNLTSQITLFSVQPSHLGLWVFFESHFINQSKPTPYFKFAHWHTENYEEKKYIAERSLIKLLK